MEGREKSESVRELERESSKPQTFKHAVIAQYKPGVSIQPTAIAQRTVTIIK